MAQFFVVSVGRHFEHLYAMQEKHSGKQKQARWFISESLLIPETLNSTWARA